MVLFKRRERGKETNGKTGNSIEELGIREPVFLRDFSKSKKHLKFLEGMIERTEDPTDRVNLMATMERIRICENRESEIIQRLKKSSLPIVCFHDLTLEYNGQVSEFDFVILSNKFILILETKYFRDYLAVNRRDTLKKEDQSKEAIMSPDSRNNRHLKFIEGIIRKELPFVNVDVLNAVVVREEGESSANHGDTRKMNIDNLVGEIEKLNVDANYSISNKAVNDIGGLLLKHNKGVESNYLNNYKLMIQ